MSAKVTVMKFGGTSIEDVPAFERVVQIVCAHVGERPVVVVSAMSRVTDALLSSLQTAASGEASQALRSIDEHLERHLKVAARLRETARAGMTKLIDGARREIAELLGAVALNESVSARLQDTVASFGERLSSALLAYVLAENELPASYVDARLCIMTDEEHGQARPLPEETGERTRAELEPLLKAGRIPVLGGFIAATAQGVTTTLGRGSSDYTATIISAALGARETQIWTDVNGVLTADPRLIKTARTVPQLSYEEAAELARNGIKVLHPKTIEPAAEHEIPVRICNSRAPKEAGTLICAQARTTTSRVKAIALKTGMTLVKVTSTPESVANGFLPEIRKIFDRHQAAFDIVATSSVGASLAYAETGSPPFIIEDLEQVGSTEVERERAVICCVGEGLQSDPRTLMRLFETLAGIEFTWHNTSDNNCALVVAEEHARAAVWRLHHAIFESDA
jgi:aspartate kinase